MKKLLLFVLLLGSTMIFSSNIIYGIYMQDSRIGTATVNFDTAARTEATVNDISLGTTRARYISKTTYNESWVVETYSLDIFVNGLKQVSSTFNYSNGVFSGSVNGMTLKDKKVENPLIVDNNITGHLCPLIFLEKGTYNVVIPSLMFNSSTDGMAVSTLSVTDKTDDTLKFSYAGVDVVIGIRNNEMASVEIPSQKVRFLRNDIRVQKEFREENVVFKSGDVSIPGTVMFPNIVKSKYPAIVLVHGSGPNDRDETIESGSVIIKPFYDLSKDLAGEGFVVLRYDKRSYLASTGEPIKSLSVYAKNAFRYLYSRDYVDKNNVFVMGHSQGASFIPLIISDVPAKGGIAYGPALLDILSQIEYQLNYQIKQLEKYPQYSTIVEETKKMIEQTVEAKKKLDDKTYTSSDSFMGASYEFYAQYMEMQKDPVKDFVNVEKPVLIINGKEDLKTPYPLILANQDKMLQNPNIRIEYLDETGHEMYLTAGSTLQFNTKIGELVRAFCSSI